MSTVPNVFLMAAGKGTRLRPWTSVVPKPVVPVANEPAMGHLLRLLARQGFHRVIANASYLADTMQAVFGDGSPWGVDLAWSVEETLLGTAGGVKRCESRLRNGDTPVVVLSGDGVHGVDIAGIVDEHRSSGALVTLALTPVDDPSEYGVAIVDESGRIASFQEKPPRDEAQSNLANTGIYVLDPALFDRIPADSFYDFGTQLFPDLMDAGDHLHGARTDAYWNDVGDLDELRATNLAAVSGAIPGIDPLGSDDGSADDVLVHPTASIDPTAALVGPCVVGPNAQVSAGAVVSSSLVLPGANVPGGHAVTNGTYGSLDGLRDWALALA